MSPTILSNIIALLYDDRETFISFLSGVKTQIPYKRPCVYTTNLLQVQR